VRLSGFNRTLNDDDVSGARAAALLIRRRPRRTDGPTPMRQRLGGPRARERTQFVETVTIWLL